MQEEKERLVRLSNGATLRLDDKNNIPAKAIIRKDKEREDMSKT